MNVNVLFSLVAASLLGLVPLNDLGPGYYSYYGYTGGLYEDGSNFIPADHLAAGLARAAMIHGKVVFLAIGFGETQRIFDAFTEMASHDPRVDRQVALINAAREGYDSSFWIPPQSEANFNRIRDTLLTPAHVTEAQVQAVWVQMVTNSPERSMTVQDGDAYRLKGALAAAMRALKSRYPNLQVAYLSSRVYGGYATTSWNPEPFAYESGFSVRWLILGQITFMRTGSLWDTRIGPIDYLKGDSPWLAWGPYLWADGTMPRSDSLTWQPDDFESDGERIAPSGARKAAGLLMEFLLHEPTASWFRSEIPRLRPARH